MKIRIISLASARARRESLTQSMSAQSLPWAFFDACDGAPGVGPRYVPEEALAARGRRLLPGEIGCFQSHWMLWQGLADSVDSEDDWWVILEDDHVLDPSFDPQEVITVAELLKIEYVRLASMYLQKFSNLGVFRGRQFVRFRSGPYGSGAYLISRAGARRLIASIPAIVRPVDDEIDSFWHNGVAAVAVYPQPALNTGMRSSSISEHGTRLSEVRTFGASIAWLATRLVRKLHKAIANVRYGSFDRRCRRISKAHL